MEKKKQLLLSVDVEDGINLIMRDDFGIRMLPTNRVVRNVEVLLALFARHDVRATFFILGEIAVHYPDLVKRISAGGHEIGVHSFSHTGYGRLEPRVIRQEVVLTRKLLEDLTGLEVAGHRAPAFSISPSNAWALEVIAEAGMKYDSSIMPAHTRRYGWPGFCRSITTLEFPGGMSLIEVPLTVTSFAGKCIPAGGGGYLRYFPLFWTEWCFRRSLHDRHALLYMHPYETDTERYPSCYYEAAKQGRLRAKIKSRLINLNKESLIPKLSALLDHFEALPVSRILAQCRPGDLPVTKIDVPLPLC